MDTKKTKIICDLIRMVYDSLDSHLDWTYINRKTKDKYFGDQTFQKKCVKEYSQMIKMLSELL